MALLTIALISTAAAGVFGAMQQQEASKNQQEELLRRARDERVEAQGAELQRREQMNRILAAQAAEGSASGIGFEGSPTKIASADVTRADLANLGATATTAGRQRALQSQARQARQLGNLRSATTLLSTAGQVGSNLPLG